MMPEKNTLFANRYLHQELKGIGSFSEVWKAIDKKAGDMVVAIEIFIPVSHSRNISMIKNIYLCNKGLQ